VTAICKHQKKKIEPKPNKEKVKLYKQYKTDPRHDIFLPVCLIKNAEQWIYLPSHTHTHITPYSTVSTKLLWTRCTESSLTKHRPATYRSDSFI